MLIRSADKTRIANIDTIRLIDIGEPNEDLSCVIYMDSRYMGEYKSEQRAIEVLDEICNAYIGLNSFKGNAPYVKNGIYQMPEE